MCAFSFIAFSFTFKKRVVVVIAAAACTVFLDGWCYLLALLLLNRANFAFWFSLHKKKTNKNRGIPKNTEILYAIMAKSQKKVVDNSNACEEQATGILI